MRLTALVAFSCPLLLGLAAAQETAYGLVLKAPAVSICMDGATHMLECSNLRLRAAAASGIDLAKWENQWVRVEGAIVAFNPSCTRMDVARIAAAAELMDLLGSWTPGGSLVFQVYGAPGLFQGLLYASGRIVISPLGPLGCLFLDPAGLRPLQFGVIPGSGFWAWTLPIPNDPLLVGLKINFQAALVDAKSMAAWLLNAACVNIK